MKELVQTGKTVEMAIESACGILGASRDIIEFEIIDLPKKGFLGLKNYPAKVRVFVKEDKAQTAVAYVDKILRAMGAEQFTLESKVTGENLNVTLKGEDLGFVIGRRGETIDAIQYLAGLAINRMDGDYMRITIDSGNFREKREKTLEALAKRLSRTAVKSGRSVTLEPMNPYERRIIHATVATVEGATSASIGEEPNRRVVISCTNPVKKPAPPFNKNIKKKPYSTQAPYSLRPNTNRKPGDVSAEANSAQAETARIPSKPYVFRPNTNTKADFAPRGDKKPAFANENKASRPERIYEEKQYDDVPVRTEVPISTPPKEAVDKPLYAKIDLE